VFISVDPRRDTTGVLRDYVQYFSAHTVAPTGKKEEIDDRAALITASVQHLLR
jgi:cytochrome oxidase Cu insertion factor (SCO1/SenC/PrrC family)